VSLFDPATGQPIAKLADPTEASGDTPPPPYLGFRPGGLLVAVARNQVTRWSVDLENAARNACLRANARLSPDEVRRYVGIAGYRPFCDTVVPEPEALLEGAAPIVPM
jgi:hypothetical protein